MPPAPKVDRGILIFDVASSRKEELLQSFLKFYGYMSITGPPSRYGVMLVNTDTSNHPDFPNMETLEETKTENLISSIRNAGSIKNGSWPRALLFAVRHITKEVPKGTITNQIVFYTTLEGDLKDVDKAVVNEIVSILTEHDLYLYIIGPDVTFPSGAKNVNDVRKLMMRLSVENPNQSLATALKILHQTENTVICNADAGFDLLLSFKRFGGSQPWKVPLTFKSGEKVWLTVPVATYKTLARDSKLKLHSMDAHKAPTYVLAEDGSEVDFKDIVSGLLKHEKLVNIPDEEMFKERTERHLEVVCFTESKNVPEALMTGEATYSTIADGENQDFFLYLLRTLAEQNKYIIAEKVYNANNAPTYVAMIPRPDDRCFLLRQISYADDVREKLTIEVPSPSGEKVQDDINNFCSLINTEINKNVPVPLLWPQLTLSPYAHNLIIAHLNKKFNLSLARKEVDLTMSPEVESLVAGLKAKWKNGNEEDEEDGSA